MRVFLDTNILLNRGPRRPPLALEALEARICLTGKSYYVRPNGGDGIGHDGTINDDNHAWQTSTRASQQVFDTDDSLNYLGGSSYAGTLNIQQSSGATSLTVQTTPGSTGTATLSITSTGRHDGIDAANTTGVTIQNINIQGPYSGTTGVGNGDGICLTSSTHTTNFTANNLDISGFDIDEHWHSDQTLVGWGIAEKDNDTNNSCNTLIENCNIHNCVLGGVVLQLLKGATVTGNTIYSCAGYKWATDASPPPNNWYPDSANGIAAFQTVGCTASLNTIHDLGSSGTSSNGSAVLAEFGSGFLVRRNMIYNLTATLNNDGAAVTFDDSSDNTIELNYAYNSAWGSFTIFPNADPNDSSPTSQNVVRFNVFADCGAFWYDASNGNNMVVDDSRTLFHNNTFYTSTTGPLWHSGLVVDATHPNTSLVGLDNVFAGVADYTIARLDQVAASILQGNDYWKPTSVSHNTNFYCYASPNNYTSLAGWQNTTAPDQERTTSGGAVGYNESPQFTSTTESAVAPNQLNTLSSFRLGVSDMTGLPLSAYYTAINRTDVPTTDFLGNSFTSSTVPEGAMGYVAPAPHGGRPPVVPQPLDYAALAAYVFANRRANEWQTIP